ncbi:rho gtpase activating protein 1, putative [Ichthyophthirius multifiliis]|uniref:Rho gtpase activating protein 1, putative n=1 Tax=Ichthyophthirius multifiliis TaxID=5932 RepID=G0QNW2_ICHMU|nr:rho gtpase activating protein 1, putative [Ichthyophthirius multifiliis]EGR33090.1 rho gtpase activating protein 1, putative [Ichthyophthirius multifiliis]|eukprot:XP_004037076.1 rho gtpase activating protein 1, putative [Ichthyophthirius multifiliis]
MDGLVEIPYYIIYFNTGLISYSHIQQFYSFYNNLPNKYYQNLKNIYIVNPSILVKSYNMFKQQTVSKEKILYLKSLKRLIKLDFMNQSLINKISKYVKDYNNYNDPIKTSQNHDKSENMEKKILFGKSLEDLELDQELMIPVIVVHLFSYFENNAQFIQEQGIFRKCATESGIKLVEKELIDKNYEYLNRVEDPHIVASCIKRFFIQLPEPIFPFKQYEKIKKFSVIQDQYEFKKKLQEIIEEIPILNYNVLKNIQIVFVAFVQFIFKTFNLRISLQFCKLSINF